MLQKERGGIPELICQVNNEIVFNIAYLCLSMLAAYDNQNKKLLA